MSVPFLDLHADASLRADIDKAIKALLDNANYIGGPEVKGFTEEFGAYCQASCVTVANGTDALILALKALGVGPGDEVIVPPFTFIATGEAVTHVGATVKFADIDPKTYTLDPTLFEKAITPKTKAVIPVHLFGQPADMDTINAIAKRKNIAVIEDAAQAHGCEYKGRRAGSLGDLACFSFYPTKNLGGFGDGGAVTSKSAELLAKVARLGDHGRAEQYFHAIEGYNSRLDSIQAAVLRLKLRQLEKQNDRRRWIATEYNKALSEQAFITGPAVAPYSKHVFHLYSVESSFRDQLQKYLVEKKIGCGVYYPLPLHLQPAYARFNHKRGDFPVSERASERILALPMFGAMTDAMVKDVCDAIKAFVPRDVAATVK